jgi:phosphatidylserine decarboxylase
MKAFLIFLIFIFITVLVVFWYLRQVWFYRDPLRKPEKEGRVIISPADGQVIYIKQFAQKKVTSKKLGEPIEIEEITKLPIDESEGWLIGIYMSPLDVHYNYAPCQGKVVKIYRSPSQVNLPMVDLWEYINLTYLRRTFNLFSKKFHFTNERNTIYIKGRGISIAVVEIADKFVNKISCYVKEGEELEAGQKISFIERGSQVDLVIFKKDLKIEINVGDQVYGGQTALASY